jgi:hypothetical protein
MIVTDGRFVAMRRGTRREGGGITWMFAVSHCLRVFRCFLEVLVPIRRPILKNL